MANLCLKIPNQDRVGLVLDISKILAGQNLNIISMEVTPNVMYLEIEALPVNHYAWLKEQLLSIPQIYDVIEIPWMPHQEREQQLKAVLDSIGEGIVAINSQEIITHFNPSAERILSYQNHEVVGKNIREILTSDIPLLHALHQGILYNNRELIATTPRGKSHYIASGRPVKDEQGNIVGAVAVLKAMRDVQDLVYSVTKPHLTTFDDILFVSDAMQRVISLSRLVSKNDSTVLIRGESGTGKELFARSIHMSSPRCDNVFAPLNCAALPDALLESELFGYEEGAFTGAKRGGKQGLFEYANDGTIFFDEIGELSAHLQAKLLRVLQEGKVRRLGGNREISVDVRIIAATHRPLEEMIRKHQFRDDLYYRLNVIPIHIPPLRERKEDLPLLIQSLLLKLNHRFKKQISHVSESAMRKLMQHNWLGNVRELENVMERAVNLAREGDIALEHIILDQESVPTTSIIEQASVRKLKDTLNELECQILREAIIKHGTSRQVGKMLGISHTAVLNRMRKYNLRDKAEEDTK
jgi:transcriptional regulator of aroF, aroG, tyrA and aromatic amino acid transport